MPSSYSTRLKLEKQATGENNNTWGTRVNDSVIDMLDEAIGGVTTIAFGTTNGDKTITNSNGATAKGRHATLVLTGAPVSNVALNVPANEKTYNVRSKHTGSYWIKLRPTGAVAGTEVTLAPSEAGIMYTDGNRMHRIADKAQSSQINAAMLPLVQASTTAAARAVLSVPDIATKAQVTSAASSNSSPTTQQLGIGILHGFKKYTDSSGAANTITVTCNPAPVSYTEIESLYIRVANTNDSTTVNINCNVLGNIRVKKNGIGGYVDPQIGDIRSGIFYEFVYDATSNVFVIMNPAHETANTVTALPGTIGFTGDNNSGTPTTQFDINASKVILTDTYNRAIVVDGSSKTINFSSTGANALDTGAFTTNTWYYLYFIYNPTTATLAGLASTSATSPTMPSGYTYKVRVGAIRSLTFAASTQLNRTSIRGKKAVYKVVAGTATPNLPKLSAGSTGSVTIPTWTSVSTSNFVPTTATHIDVILNGLAATGAFSICAPNSGYDNYLSTSNPPPIANNAGAAGNNTPTVKGEIQLESTNIFFASSATNASLWCYGWTDAVNNG